MEADFERDFPVKQQQNPLNHRRNMLEWSFIKQNTFKLLKWMDKNPHPIENHSIMK